ncbi:MAG: hypothetical protein ACQERK_06955 [Campylobacterota bacterium]
MQTKILFINEKNTLDENTRYIYKTMRRDFSDVRLIVESNYEKILHVFDHIYRDVELLIIDHHMPKGVTLVHLLLQKRPELKTIVCSGSPYCCDPVGCEHCQENFNKKRLRKPVSKDTLFETIHAFETKKCEYQYECKKAATAGFLL